MSRRGDLVYEDRDYYRESATPRAPPTRVRERDYDEVDSFTRREPDRDRRLDFLRDDYGRRSEVAGPVVLRERDRETDVYATRHVEARREPSVERVRTTTRLVKRASSPSPIRMRERVVERARSFSPVERVRSRTIISERAPSPEPERLRKRVVETRERIVERSISPVRIRERIIEREPSPSPPVRIRERYIERERERSRSPPRMDRFSIREQQVARIPSPSPSPSPPREISLPPIRAPPIHQEIITHHRHINHGFEKAHVPSPPPPIRHSSPRTRETDIDIHTSRNNTEIDIRQSTARSRTPQPVARRSIYEEDISYEDRERDRLQVSSASKSETRVDIRRRRSHSARPSPRIRTDIHDEADYFDRKVGERAYIGEAYNGATKDWAIVDVPPGTERIRMDGVGGGAQEITWQRYNGVRRSKFIAERERDITRDVGIGGGRDTGRERIEVNSSSAIEPRRETTGLEIEITSSSRRKESGKTYERDREYERIEESGGDRRVGLPRGPKNRAGELWTEITKDLVVKEAIDSMGYDYDETDFFFYVMQYLRYEDVLALVQLSESIRRDRHDRLHEMERERMRLGARLDHGYMERRRERDVLTSGPVYDDERIIEREVVYGDGGSGGGGRRRRF